MFLLQSKSKIIILCKIKINFGEKMNFLRAKNLDWSESIRSTIDQCQGAWKVIRFINVATWAWNSGFDQRAAQLSLKLAIKPFDNKIIGWSQVNNVIVVNFVVYIKIIAQMMNFSNIETLSHIVIHDKFQKFLTIQTN